MSNRLINLDNTPIKTAIRIMLAESDTRSLAAVARKLDLKETTLRSSINNNAIRLADFINIAKHLGYTVTVKSNE